MSETNGAGISDIWYLDLWGFMAIFLIGFGLLFLLIGTLLAAGNSSKESARQNFKGGLEIFTLFTAAGILFPLIPLLILYGIGKGIRKALF